MDLSLLTKYFSVALAATIKFLAGPVAGLALGLHWIETAICSVIGMMFTVLLISFVGEAIRKLVDKWRKTPAKRFTKMSRMAVGVWLKFGIIGIAFLTPLLFTPPVGSVLAVAFRVPRAQVIGWMLLSGIIWGAVFSFLIYKLKFLQAFIS